MTDKTSIPPTSMLDAVEPGDMFSIQEDGPRTIEFAGKTFHVVAYVGGKDGGCLQVTAGDPAATDTSDVVSRFLLAAANLLAIGVDWRKVAPPTVAEMGATMFASHFYAVLEKHRKKMAERRKN